MSTVEHAKECMSMRDNFYSFPRNFGLIPKRVQQITWYGCREAFHRYINKRKQFLFAGRNCANTIRPIERALNIPNKERAKIVEVREGIYFVDITGFWSDENMRRSLFTILCKYGRNHHYIQDTKYAFDRFMNGHTHYTGRSGGWYRTFRTNYDRIDELLV